MMLLSFTAQARTAFACAMMPGAALAHCCCPMAGAARCPMDAGGHACCEVVAATDALLSHATAHSDQQGRHQAHFGSIDLSPVAAVESYFLPASFDSGDQRPIFIRPDTDRYRLRPQYLLTARLRL